MNRSPQLLIADDTLTAQCLQRLLEGEFPGVEIATTVEALVTGAATHRPDLVLLDVRGAAFDGFEAMRRLGEVSPITKVMVVTKQDEPEYVAESLRAGASGYLLKWCAVSELVTAIHAVLNGHSYLTSSLSKRGGSTVISGTGSTSKSLTARQREVLQLVAQGRTAKEIANVLGLSVKTAVFHKMSIMDKLGLRTTAELTRYAMEHGILASIGKAKAQTTPQLNPLAPEAVTA